MPVLVKDNCEAGRYSDGLLCPATAAWIVQVGTRKTDAQRACSVHLSRVCRALYAAEERDGAVLTVRPVP